MSLAKLNFLESWVDDNIVGTSLGELRVVEARRLVNRCIAEAKKQGISLGDLEEEVGDLTAFLAAALKSESCTLDTVRGIRSLI